MQQPIINNFGGKNITAMQRRTFEFKADDSTKSLNEWLLSIITPGVYRGFDAFIASNDLNLVLQHTSTAFNYDSSQNGIIRTKEGVIVWEDADVSIGPVETSTLKRIDCVTLNHTYIETEGGQSALYSIIKGVEHASTPVAPAVPTGHVKIGELHLPTGFTQLDNVGVVWVREKIPLLGDDPSRMNLKADLVNGIVPDAQIQHKSYIYDNIAARDAAMVWDRKEVYVKDASADTTVSNGSGATYIYDLATTSWKKISEDEKSVTFSTSITANSGYTVFGSFIKVGKDTVRFFVSSERTGADTTASAYHHVCIVPSGFESNGGVSTWVGQLLYSPNPGVVIPKTVPILCFFNPLQANPKNTIVADINALSQINNGASDFTVKTGYTISLNGIYTLKANVRYY